MSDFEDRLGRALNAGAEDAPGVVGLADGARARLKRRRTVQVSIAGAAAVLLAVLVPVTLLGGGGTRDGLETAETAETADPGPGWRSVSLERPAGGGAGTVTVLLDVPESWTTPETSPQECAVQDFALPAGGACSSVEVVEVLGGDVAVDFATPTGLSSRDEVGGRSGGEWQGHVSLGGPQVVVSSNDYQVALRVLASARLQGQRAPDVAGETYVVTAEGVARPALRLDEAAGYGVTISPRRSREEYAFAREIRPDLFRAVATVGEKRIEVLAPTPAVAELIAGSARPAPVEPDDGWRTLTHDGDPSDPSGDSQVLVDLPPDWQRLDTSSCYDTPRYGPVGSDPCDNASTLTFFPESLYDSLGGAGLVVDAASGYVVVGDVVAQVVASDHETARRLLASVRRPGESAPSATWRTEQLAGIEVDLPDDGSVSVELARPSGVASLPTRAARQGPDGTWSALVARASGNAIHVVAPTQALADVVASSVRPAG